MLDSKQIQVSSMNVSRCIKYIDIYNTWSNPTIEVEFDCSLNLFEVIFSKRGRNHVIDLFPSYRVGWQLGQRLNALKIEERPGIATYAKAWEYGKAL